MFQVTFKKFTDIIVHQLMHVLCYTVLINCITQIDAFIGQIILQFAWTLRKRMHNRSFFGSFNLPFHAAVRAWKLIISENFFVLFCNRPLTIGQMQGKFQMVVVRHTGHAIQVHWSHFLTILLYSVSYFWKITNFIYQIIAGRFTWGICFANTQFHIS